MWGLAMKHVNLDTQDEAVKRFVLSLSADPDGSLLELEGRAVLQVLPIARQNNGSATREEWTEAKNARRCDLIDKEIAGTLSSAEAEELAGLQREMLRHRRRVAPLPLEAARRLHQELLDRAQTQAEEGDS
jgi:hypothetical protein